MSTFVHTADIHLDTPFSANFTKHQMQLRRREIMQTFRNIVLSAKDKDFLFISGDLFDGEYVSSDTITFVQRCFDDIPDTHVFISAGNHDPYTPNSVYCSVRWGDNVHVFDTSWEYVDFPEKKTRIHGISFGNTHEQQTLLAEVPVKPEWCNLIVLHGELISTGGKSEYNPIEKSLLQETRADYIALGHIHQRSELARINGVYYAYCGIPEGRGFDEEGEKGYYVGEAEKGTVNLTWVPSCSRRFLHLYCDVSNARDGIEIQEIIEKAIRDTGNESDCFKVMLTGTVRRGMVNIEVLKEALAGKVFFLDIQDRTTAGYMTAEITKDNSLRNDFIMAMQEKIASMPDEDREIGYLALEVGLSAMERGRDA